MSVSILVLVGEEVLYFSEVLCDIRGKIPDIKDKSVSFVDDQKLN